MPNRLSPESVIELRTEVQAIKKTVQILAAKLEGLDRFLQDEYDVALGMPRTRGRKKKIVQEEQKDEPIVLTTVQYLECAPDCMPFTAKDDCTTQEFRDELIEAVTTYSYMNNDILDKYKDLLTSQNVHRQVSIFTKEHKFSIIYLVASGQYAYVHTRKNFWSKQTPRKLDQTVVYIAKFLKYLNRVACYIHGVPWKDHPPHRYAGALQEIIKFDPVYRKRAKQFYKNSR